LKKANGGKEGFLRPRRKNAPKGGEKDAVGPGEGEGKREEKAKRGGRTVDQKGSGELS